jgi:hypothetical protein
LLPALIAVQSLNVVIWVGTRRSSVVPSPTAPLSLRPQHHKVPGARSPQAFVWLPALIAIQSLKMPTGVGVCRSSFVPSPTPPKKFAPQHYAVPGARKPQLSKLPTLIAVQSAKSPIRVGADRSLVVPSPNFPKVLWPQHHKVPERNPHAEAPPASPFTQSVRASNWTVFGRSDVVPSPKPPPKLSPQL